MTFEETLRAPLDTKWCEAEEKERRRNRTINISNKLAFSIGIPLIAALSFFTGYMVKDIQTKEQQIQTQPQGIQESVQEQYETPLIIKYPEVYHL